MIIPYRKPYRSDVYDFCRVKCSCSHSIFIPVYVKKVVCNHCGEIVYNKREQFKMKLKEVMEKC